MTSSSNLPLYLIPLITLTLLSPPTHGEAFISPTGTDIGSCTSGAPCASPCFAWNVNSTIVAASGIYNSSAACVDDGQWTDVQLTLTGAGVGVTVFDFGAISSPFWNITVNASSPATEATSGVFIEDLTISGTTVSSGPGMILNAPDVTVRDVSVNDVITTQGVFDVRAKSTSLVDVTVVNAVASDGPGAGRVAAENLLEMDRVNTANSAGTEAGGWDVLVEDGMVVVCNLNMSDNAATNVNGVSHMVLDIGNSTDATSLTSSTFSSGNSSGASAVDVLFKGQSGATPLYLGDVHVSGGSSPVAVKSEVIDLALYSGSSVFDNAGGVVIAGGNFTTPDGSGRIWAGTGGNVSTVIDCETEHDNCVSCGSCIGPGGVCFISGMDLSGSSLSPDADGCVCAEGVIGAGCTVCEDDADDDDDDDDELVWSGTWDDGTCTEPYSGNDNDDDDGDDEEDRSHIPTQTPAIVVFVTMVITVSAIIIYQKIYQSAGGPNSQIAPASKVPKRVPEVGLAVV